MPTKGAMRNGLEEAAQGILEWGVTHGHAAKAASIVLDLWGNWGLSRQSLDPDERDTVVFYSVAPTWTDPIHGLLTAGSITWRLFRYEDNGSKRTSICSAYKWEASGWSFAQTYEFHVKSGLLSSWKPVPRF